LNLPFSRSNVRSGAKLSSAIVCIALSAGVSLPACSVDDPYDVEFGETDVMSDGKPGPGW
jgi:hypothetical protein